MMYCWSHSDEPVSSCASSKIDHFRHCYSDPAVLRQLRSDQKGHEPDQHLVGDCENSAFRCCIARFALVRRSRDANRPKTVDFQLHRPRGSHQSAFGAPGGASPRTDRAFGLSAVLGDPGSAGFGSAVLCWRVLSGEGLQDLSRERALLA